MFQVQLQAFVENIRDKLAENIHEMWAVTKIETGWIYGEERDDLEMLHPCLTQFQNLPTAEKRYNIQLALQTLRYFRHFMLNSADFRCSKQGILFNLLWIYFYTEN